MKLRERGDTNGPSRLVYQVFRHADREKAVLLIVLLIIVGARGCSAAAKPVPNCRR